MWKMSKYESILAVFFLLTLPLLRPWVHGDGRGYYAYARAILLQHNLDFELDWEKGYETAAHFHDPGFRQNYLTPNGHINNHWTIGPAILWSPFLLCGRAAALLGDSIAHTALASDGFSKPYLLAVAFGTYVYGFLALLFSMRLAKRYFPERWAFLATVAIWLATSFAFYLYAEPSFSHIPSAFLVSLFVLIWDSTRRTRTLAQWLALGVLAGLIMDTYYANVPVLLLPLFDVAQSLWNAFRKRDWLPWKPAVLGILVFATAALIAFIPSLLTKKILYDSYFHSGYKQAWYLNSPAFFRVCFSSHGVFSWTPILIPAVIGLFALRKVDRELAKLLLITVAAFFYLIGCYQDWHAIPSFGNRFFISLTPFFVLGLTASLVWLSGFLKEERLWSCALATTILLIVWNFGLMFQFGAHLFPQDADVSWKSVAYNQVAVVPSEAGQWLKRIITQRTVSQPTVVPSARVPISSSRVVGR
jgi:hypothetical protein